MENIEAQVIAKIDEIKGKLADFATKGEVVNFVKKEDLDLLAKSADLEALTTIVNQLNEKQGQLAINQKSEQNTFEAISEGIAKNLNAADMSVKKFKVPFKTKAAGTMTAADDLTGNTVITYRSQLVGKPYSNVHMRDLAAIIPSATGTFSWYRQVAGEGAINFQTSHGTKKSIINAKFVQSSVTAEYLAGLAPVAKQMMQDLPFLQGFMPSFLLTEYLKKEDSEFFADLQIAATGSTANVGTANIIEQIMRWATNLRAADHAPNGVVLNPTDVYQIFTNAAGGSGEYDMPPGVVISNSGAISIFGIPVFTSTFVTVGRTIVGDWSKAGIVQVDGLGILTDDRGGNFDNNTVTFKAEARVALAVLDPTAFVAGTFSFSA